MVPCREVDLPEEEDDGQPSPRRKISLPPPPPLAPSWDGYLTAPEHRPAFTPEHPFGSDDEVRELASADLSMSDGVSAPPRPPAPNGARPRPQNPVAKHTAGRTSGIQDEASESDGRAVSASRSDSDSD
jgi:hypothetical protein